MKECSACGQALHLEYFNGRSDMCCYCEDDPVNHPAHYTKHPSGVECIDITEHMNFTLGNAVKYIWRASLKGKAVEDLQKAAWYINREIERLQK